MVATSYPCVEMFDAEVESAGHFAVVGELEASAGRLANQDLVEEELVLILDINAFGVGVFFRGELAAVRANVMLLKDGGRVQYYSCRPGEQVKSS